MRKMYIYRTDGGITDVSLNPDYEWTEAMLDELYEVPRKRLAYKMDNNLRRQYGTILGYFMMDDALAPDEYFRNAWEWEE